MRGHERCTAEDLRFCRELLPRVSRTFALSIEALPPALRLAVRTSYLLCRLVDTIEDANHLSADDREALFDRFDALIADEGTATGSLERLFEERLAPTGGVDPAALELGLGSGAILRAYRALGDAQRRVIGPVVLEMSRGMREYVSRPPEPWGGIGIVDLEDLERYCYFVAGVVGRLLTGLFLQQVPSASRADEADLEKGALGFGIGLQLVNITKDVAEDYQRGVCFLPRELASSQGLEIERLLEEDQREAGLRVIHLLTRRARTHLALAERYVALWPAQEGAMVRLFCIVPLALAYATLDEIERGSATLRSGKSPAVSRAVVAQILQQAGEAAHGRRPLDLVFGAHRAPPEERPEISLL